MPEQTEKFLEKFNRWQFEGGVWLYRNSLGLLWCAACFAGGWFVADWLLS